MERPRAKINALKKNYQAIIDVIDKGNIFVAQGQGGFCILINNKSEEGYKIVTFNPNTDMLGRADLPKEAFYEMYKKVILKCNFDLFEVEENGYDLIESYEFIADALLAVKNGSDSKYYKVRRLD